MLSGHVAESALRRLRLHRTVLYWRTDSWERSKRRAFSSPGRMNLCCRRASRASVTTHARLRTISFTSVLPSASVSSVSVSSHSYVAINLRAAARERVQGDWAERERPGDGARGAAAGLKTGWRSARGVQGPPLCAE